MLNEIILNGIRYSYKENFDVNLTLTYENDKWGAWEIIREFLSNALDSVSGDRNKIYIEHSEGNHIIHDYGPGYPIFYAKRIGASCKKGNSDSIGQFGEGIKMSILSCLRNNIEVILGSQNWLIVPYINNIEGQDVLFYNIYEAEENIDGSIVSIEGNAAIDEIFNNLAEYFLIYNNSPALFGNMKSGIYPQIKGISKLYNKGVFIKDINGQYSYAVCIENINRDRNIISNDDLAYKIRDIYEFVTDENIIISILQIDSKPYEIKKNYIEFQCNFRTCYPEKWKDAFESLYGDNSLIGTSDISGREAESLGYTPIYNLDYSVCRILKDAGVREDINCLSDDYEFVWADTLTKSEKDVLDELPKYAKLAGFNDLPQTIRVFSEYMNHDGINGCYNPDKGEIYLKKDILDLGLEQALKTYLHESTHHETGYDDLNRYFADALCSKLTELLLKYTDDVGVECQVDISDNVLELPENIMLSAKDLTAFISVIGNDFVLSAGNYILKAKLKSYTMPVMYKRKISIKNGSFNVLLPDELCNSFIYNEDGRCTLSLKK